MELVGLKDLKETLSDFEVKTPTEKDTEKSFEGIGPQINMVSNILEDNSSLINQLSETNENLATNLIQNDESQEGFDSLTNSLESVVNSLNDIGATLKVNLGKLVTDFGESIMDDKIEVETRKEMLTNLRDFVEKQGVESPALEELKKINIEELRFTKEESENVQRLMSDLADDTLDVKVYSTLRELHKNLELSEITQEKIQDSLEEKPAVGRESKILKALESITEQGPRGFMGEMMSRTMGTVGGKILGKLGTGVFGKLASAVMPAAMGGAPAAPALLGAGKGILSKMGGLGGIAKFAGPIAGIALAVKGAFDFAKGWSNAAKIAGLKEGEEVTTLQKMSAGISSVISGLTFGLVDAESIFKTIEKGVNFLFGDDGVFKPLIDFFTVELLPIIKAMGAGMFKDLGKYFKLFGAFWGGIGKILKFVMPYIAPILKLGFKALIMPLKKLFGIIGGVADLFIGEGSFLTRLWNLVKKVIDFNPAAMILQLITGTDSLFGPKGAFTKIGSWISGLGEDLLASWGWIKEKIMIGFDFIFGEKGVLGTLGGWMKKLIDLSPLALITQLITGTDSLFGPEGAFAKIGSWISDLPDKVENLIRSLAPSWTHGILGIEKKEELPSPEEVAKMFQQPFGQEMSIIPGATPVPVLGEGISVVPKIEQLPVMTGLGETVTKLIKEEKETKAKMLEKIADKQVQIPPIVVDTSDKASQGVDKSMSIDDYGIALMNATVFQ